MSKMTTWRRLLALALVLTLAISFTACTNKKTGKKDDTKKENTVGKQETQDPVDVNTDSGVIAGNSDVTAEDILNRTSHHMVNARHTIGGRGTFVKHK